MQLDTAADPNHVSHSHAVMLLACSFVQGLHQTLGPQLFEAAALQDVFEDSSVSHFHDNCDANQVLLDAARELFGPDMDEGKFIEAGQLIDSTWALARGIAQGVFRC